MAAMDSLNHDPYTGNPTDTDKLPLNASIHPPATSLSASNNQDGELSIQPVDDDITLYTTVPEMTASENLNNYVLINLQDLQDKVWSEMRTPFLVLTNNEKGNVETKVLYNTSSSPSSVGLLKLPTNGTNIHTLAPSGVVGQPTPNQSMKPTHKTLICVSSGQEEKEEAMTVDKSETPSQQTSCLESKQSSSTPVSDAATLASALDRRSLGSEQISTDTSKPMTIIGYKKANPLSTASQGGQRSSLECSFEGCERKFSWPAHLKYHQMTHTGERQYVCTSSGCLKTFYTSQRLAVHIRTHTGEKPFKCQEEGCEKAFTTAGNLKNHIRVHTGERPFVCSYAGCSRSFAEYSSLRKHKLVHTGEKPFNCDECGKSFSQSGSRAVHIKRHHVTSAKITTSSSNSSSNNNNINNDNNNNKGKTTTTTTNGPEVIVAAPQQQTLESNEKGSTNIFILRNTSERGVEEEEDGIIQYQDFSVGESVVFSQAMSDHVVTVTTQPCPPPGGGGGGDGIELEGRVINDQIVTLTSQSLFSPPRQNEVHSIEHGATQRILSTEILPDESLGQVSLSSNNANVMVISQPQEIVSLASANGRNNLNTTTRPTHNPSYHSNNQRTTSDIIFENELIHKEMPASITHHILSISAPLAQQQNLDDGTPSSLLHSGKDVVLDPMMASDDDDDDDDNG